MSHRDIDSYQAQGPVTLLSSSVETDHSVSLSISICWFRFLLQFHLVQNHFVIVLWLPGYFTSSIFNMLALHALYEAKTELLISLTLYFAWTETVQEVWICVWLNFLQFL